ncbi:MAG: hypothetical protein LBU97_05580 [Alistipes sp.]|nr:hypothetical protein [Alistipes sp.]
MARGGYTVAAKFATALKRTAARLATAATAATAAAAATGLKRATATAASVTAAIATTALVGCVSGTDVAAADVSPDGWHRAVAIPYSNSDAHSLRDLTLTLRHSATASVRSGRYVVGALSPSGFHRADTLVVDIAPDPRTNSLRESHAVWPGIRLDEQGEWRFTVTPFGPTVGVWSVAVELRRAR